MSDTIPVTTLTYDPEDGTYGYDCHRCETARRGLSERHAVNAEAKHLRDMHPTATIPPVNLSEGAIRVMRAAGVIASEDKGSPAYATAMTVVDFWAAITGQESVQSALRLAADLRALSPHRVITADVAPF